MKRTFLVCLIVMGSAGAVFAQYSEEILHQTNVNIALGGWSVRVAAGAAF